MNIFDKFSYNSLQSNGSDDLTPRKRPRKQQFGEFGTSGMKKFQSDLDAQIQSEPQVAVAASGNDQGVSITFQNVSSAQANTSTASILTNRNAVKTNNENSPPKIVDYFIKRPKACNLLEVSLSNFCMSSFALIEHVSTIF